MIAACVCPAVSVCESDLLVVIPPALGLFAALSRGFSGGVQVEPGEGCQLYGSEGIRKDSFWKDLYFGLSDPEGRNKERQGHRSRKGREVRWER